MKSISIIIPVYNEEKYIHHTIDYVIRADSLQLKKEIIVIDDHSTDSTKKILTRFSKQKIPRTISIKYIYQKRHEGKGSAIKKGLLCSTGDIVLIQDADLEYSPENYPQLLEPFIKHNVDVVYGSRFISDKPHRVLYFWHSVGNTVLTLLSNMCTNLNLTDMETGYKVFKGPLIRSIAPSLTSKRFGFEPEVTARLSKIEGLQLFEVGISYWGRTYAEGKKISWKDGLLAVWYIIYFNFFCKE